MLTLEQVSAVNDGFHRGDLNAALAPLEETIDLRANELPRLDKKAVAALKNGLANGDDAATWAQAVLHPNVSVRRFARKVLMPLGDEAEPLFAPLRARLERFWAEEEPLPDSMKPREAAARREQSEQVGSALELLLRADPPAFAEFYAQMVDNAPLGDERADEWQRWQERNAAAWKKTQDETTRLLKAEWGEKFAGSSERYKLPSRVLREVDERARQNPEIAVLWRELGEGPWGNVAPTWNPSGLAFGTWNSYLNADKPTGPIERVNAQLQPVLWRWLQGAFDPKRDLDERLLLVRRLNMGGGVAYQLRGWIGRERLLGEVPALLLQSKAPLLPVLKAALARQADYTQKYRAQGEEIVAEFWLSLATALGNSLRRPYQTKVGEWETPAIEPATLRALAQDFPDDKQGRGAVQMLRGGATEIEKERAAQSAPNSDAPLPEKPAVEAVPHQTDRDLLSEMLGTFANDRDYPNLQAVQAKIASLKAEAARMKDDERVKRLVESAPHPKDPHRVLLRVPNWKIWAGGAQSDETREAQLKAALWPRAEPQLWARFEAQLEAHRRMETEAIEPDVKQKLTEREAKEWRARVRREKRQNIAADIVDIANLLIYVDGLPAQLRAIELADRPSCREVRDQLERRLFYSLEEFPGRGTGSPPPPQEWEKWKLDAQWDAILERAETRLSEAKDEWTRNVLERELAIGYYRRGDFARFEAHLSRPESFPVAVAKAAVFFDDFAAWQALVARFSDNWAALHEFWLTQQSDDKRRARALEVVVQTLTETNADEVAKTLLKWLAPLDATEFEPHFAEIENALESPLAPVKKWAMQTLGKLDKADFDRERAAQTASESLWSENVGLAKDAAKFLAVLATQDEATAELAWNSLNDATSLENIPLCEAVFRALVKIKSKHKALELSETAREKLELLSRAQSERFGKFASKLIAT